MYIFTPDFSAENWFNSFCTKNKYTGSMYIQFETKLQPDIIITDSNGEIKFIVCGINM